MSERLTDEHLREIARSFTDQSIEAAAVNEALALRARAAKLEAALKGARPYVQGLYDATKYGDGGHIPKLVLDAIDDALKDAPQ
jgi:hypothetical protein